MGGAVSAGVNNDDLIDNLLEDGYIKTSTVERIFRAVDRGEYFLPDSRGTAYKDLAWKSGNLHISAPCIYSEVMEGLNLESGLSFLNLGSGTGYLSTMAGLILGTGGINHGIEIHEDVVEYAIKKLEDFKKHSGAMDEFDFCEPKFIQGNCLCLNDECAALYDRIYCGAACPEEYEPYMKNLLKVGGILVMPLNDQLLQIKRLSECQWNVKSLLAVSFATLIPPLEGLGTYIKPIEVEPLSLQVLCRCLVRNILRNNIEKEHPPTKRNPSHKKKRAARKMVIPLSQTMDSSDDELPLERINPRSRRDGYRREEDGIFRYLLDMRHHRDARDRGRPSQSNNNNHREPDNDLEPEAMDTEYSDDSSHTHHNEEPTAPSSQEVRAVIEHHEDDNEEHVENDHNSAYVNRLDRAIVERLDIVAEALARRINRQQQILEQFSEPSPNRETDSQMNVPDEQSASHPGTSSKDSNKREKFDSGLGDEIIEAPNSSEDENMRLDNDRDEEHSMEKRYKRGSSTETDEEDEEIKLLSDGMRMYESPYTEFMREKIQQLPLPPILKRYLNFYRDFKKPGQE